MGLPFTSDIKIPEVPFEFTKEHVEIVCMLHFFFESDSKKVAQWMNTKNPAMGEITPKNLFFLRQKKLLQFIENAAKDEGWW